MKEVSDKSPQQRDLDAEFFQISDLAGENAE